MEVPQAMIDEANRRAAATGENGAEELLQMLLSCGAVTTEPTKPQPE